VFLREFRDKIQRNTCDEAQRLVLVPYESRQRFEELFGRDDDLVVIAAESLGDESGILKFVCLTLGEAVRIAARQNPQVGSARSRLGVAEARVTQRRADLLPTFSLDAQQGLRDVGLDSLLALELRNRLQSAVESPLPATLAFDFPTVADLARHLAQNVLLLELTAPSDHPASDESARQTALDEIDELSDEMAEALLNAELSGVRGDRGERN